VRDASANNLKHIEHHVSVGLLTVVTGVSGSGKSTLVEDILYARLRQALSQSGRTGPACEHRGLEHIDKIIEIDQSRLAAHRARIPRPTPDFSRRSRTLFNAARKRERGYKPGFSSTSKAGAAKRARATASTD